MTALANSLATRAQTLGQQVIANLSPLYYKGVFYQEDMGNYHLNGFPHAALMATLSKYTSNSTLASQYTTMINEIVTRALATNTDTSGRFFDGAPTTGPFAGFYGQGPDRTSMGSALNANTMIEQTANLAWILTQKPGVFPSTWLSVCQANCDYLDTFPGAPITTYWINGNYNCQLLGTYWFTAMASVSDADKAKYVDMYERALNFLVSPATYQPVSFPSPWGLTLDVTGSQYDWSDYLAHLTETNTRGADPRPDWDPNYSLIQLDALSRVFTFNRDTRLIRLINAISNKTETKLDSTTWIIDGTAGSRQHSMAGYANCYYEVTAMLGAKGTNTTLLDSTHTLDRWDNGVSPNILVNSTNGYYAAGTARQLGLAVATVREAAEIAKFSVAAS